MDFVGGHGGGIRFTAGLLRALGRLHPDVRIDVISFGSALDRYRAVFPDASAGTTTVLRPVRPRRYWQHLPASRLWGLPGTGWIKRQLGFGRAWHYDVLSSALDGYDGAWFPWILQHQLPQGVTIPIVATCHDTIVFQWPGLLSTGILQEAHRVVRTWLRSPARIAVGSTATQAAMAELFGVDASRLTVIPPGWDHLDIRGKASVDPHPALRGSRYILCAANTSPHKNHETLFQGLALWGAKIPGVLIGRGADLLPDDLRGAQLRRWAERWGLQIGQGVIPLGYVAEEEYRRLLAHAWAVVMPSLREGGGSFPVMEAMMTGIPTISADIPVMRELLFRVGGEVLWFDPTNAESLAAQLHELERDYDHYRRRAETQAATLSVPTWEEAARAYWALMTQ